MSDDDENKKSKKPKKSKYLLAKEAARELRVSPGTLANWRCKGTGPKWRKHGGTVVYTEEEIERYSDDDDKTHIG
ncbi:MAG: helix-turn-helix domain-containing protein [Pseudomonadota bacterium]